jgi:hypothetical protein
VREVRVSAWPDQSDAQGDLAKEQARLTSKRNAAIRSFLKKQDPDIPVKTANMGKEQADLGTIKKHPEKTMREELRESGIAAQDQGKLREGRALVVVILAP